MNGSVKIMKTRYYILAGVLYTLFIGFTASAIQGRITAEKIKDQCFVDGCTKVYEYTGEVGGEEWEELIIIAEEANEEAEMWKADAEAKWESDENPYYNSGSDSDADAYINLFFMLSDPINWIFTLIIATFIAGFYLAFYSCKLAIEKYFKGNNTDE